MRFKESYPVKDVQVRTPWGWQNVESVHKTFPLRKYEITLENSLSVECAECHVFIDENWNEVHAKDCLGTVLRTESGNSKVISVKDTGITEEMYDVSLEGSNELYYSNGILSHNSGKSITTAIYLSWCFLFMKNINIGICGNRASTARDFLSNVKNIFVNLPIWLQQGIGCWNAGSIYSENGVSIFTDATNGDSFRGRAINILVVDEVAFIRPTTFDEFSDSVMPTQSSLAWKKTLLLSTPNGMNHFYKIVKDTRDRKILDHISPEDVPTENVLEVHDNSDGTKTVVLDESSNGFELIDVDWKEVPRYDSKGNRLTPEEFRDQVIAKYGIQYFKQNYECDFIGSSATLISPDVLCTLKAKRPFERMLSAGQMIRIFKESQEKHKYVLAVDPAKDGKDYFAIQIIDITKFPFVQAASAKLQVDYLMMPGYIHDLGIEYNTALVIVENNEGAGQSIADTLLRDYEYQNLYYDRDQQGRYKKYPGYRTTSKTRTQMLNTLKMLVENGKVVINDANTIFELERFALQGKKYQAIEGYHDDLVMALAISFCMFNNINNFNDIKELADKIYSEDQSSEFTDLITLGDFDDGTYIDFDSKSFDGINYGL